ncbi:hypothetical protein [Roseovarius tolerans]|uniref:hypothetical protein n=1 Tax=Roseovarius tolerans TaxID=74031 RepID=UPI0019104CC7|nr:hypothetical protein [Roseovarius tolerans]
MRREGGRCGSDQGAFAADHRRVRAIAGTLSDRMDEMRRDFDWLVSDRMIEQAVDMARLGQSHDSIAQTTGVSSAELDAIRKLRRH